MKRTFAGAVITSAIVAAGIFTVGCSEAQPEISASAQSKVPERVKRGEYLVKIMGCNDCHTPFKMGPNGPEPDMTRALTGHPEQTGPLPVAKADGPWLWAGAATNTAFSGPWGISYAANLTPDQNTGLGIWTEEMFIKAIRTGRHMGVSREILPPMPWPTFRHASDEDLKSLYAFLRSLKPVVNHVPDAQPAAAAAAEEK